jgi:type III restriction enzyme
MSGFNFEKNLSHQDRGASAVLDIFIDADIQAEGDKTTRLKANPSLKIDDNLFHKNIKLVQSLNDIEHNKESFDGSTTLDISMETGTGKTYTYTKTMYELNRTFGINKFIIVIPTLSIKAGTVNFLKSESLKEHFREDYNRKIKTYVVESQKGSKKNSKAFMPQSIRDFVNANSINKEYIHVLIINAGMINSDSLTKKYDTSLFDNQFDTPFDALEAVKPFVIIDEPHKFPTAKKTWANIERLGAQYIIRYGATFSEGYKNLLYRLTAVDAFNQDLVKGIDAFIEYVVGDDNATVKLVASSTEEAKFELNDNGKRSTYLIGKGESLSAVHSEMHDLFIENLNKSKVVLSNGIELNLGASINPYSYAQTLQDNMMQKAIKEHFKIERNFLTQRPRIKPLTLFFIDDIEGYRNGNEISGSLKEKFESWVVAEAEMLLKKESDPFYREYLEKTISDVSLVHGGYFSKDNSGKDDKVEQEINEILHDKELLLSLENPRRFIFSKWTLREGWDNPNVFQICKLRSSGSTTSKLQEVGRGLRLPVNEYMSRVKGQEFRLNYYVDFTESKFVEDLKNEINSSSFNEEVATVFDDSLKSKIMSAYPELTKRQLTNQLDDEGIIDDNDNFIGNGYGQLKELFPKAFPSGVKKGKIRIANDQKPRTKMREGKYEELRDLWELINHKAILEYKINSEDEFRLLLTAYLEEEAVNFKKTGVRTKKQSLYIYKNNMVSKDVDEIDDDFTPLVTMEYHEFLERLSKAALIKLSTLHSVFVELRDKLEIADFLNVQTIRKIKSGFKKFLLNNSFSHFELGYTTISNSIHPTKFTDISGKSLEDALASDLGVHHDDLLPPDDAYLFEEVFYDSELERDNIVEEVESVTVFTKIPKNSIKIPVAGGFSYSPDFAYIIKTKKGEFLNFVIETKNVDGKDSLRKQEEKKIKHAEALFSCISKDIEVRFSTQFQNEKIGTIIREYIQTRG